MNNQPQEVYMLYEQPKNKRILIIPRPITRPGAYGMEFVECCDSLEQVCDDAERMKLENEEEDEVLCPWQIDIIE